MNIFYLDNNLTLSAQYYMDRHIVKIPLEIAQMLSTAQSIYHIPSAYKPTHCNHPTNVWVRTSKQNYDWTCMMGLELCKEYTYRYKRVHACQSIIENCIKNMPPLADIGLTQFYLAMPNDCKMDNVVDSYRQYYIKYKKHLAKWKNRNVPSWFV